MKPASPGVKLTYDDFMLFPDDGKRHELSNARAAQVLTPLHARGTPELVVEVVSPSTRGRDETIKRRLYEKCGVDEYWVLDPEIDVIRVYCRARGTFERPAELSREADDLLTTPLLPGLEMRLGRIFR